MPPHHGRIVTGRGTALQALPGRQPERGPSRDRAGMALVAFLASLLDPFGALTPALGDCRRGQVSQFCQKATLTCQAAEMKTQRTFSLGSMPIHFHAERAIVPKKFLSPPNTGSKHVL